MPKQKNSSFPGPGKYFIKIPQSDSHNLQFFLLGQKASKISSISVKTRKFKFTIN